MFFGATPSQIDIFVIRQDNHLLRNGKISVHDLLGNLQADLGLNRLWNRPQTRVNFLWG